MSYTVESEMANPRLSLNAPSSLWWDLPGSQTPPPQKPGSVPFLWEEKPGKPKACSTSLFGHFSSTPTDSTGSLSVRSLELPPRLVAKMKAMQSHVDLDSPTTVLDGPDLAKPGAARVQLTCHSFSYYREPKKKPKREKEAWLWKKKKNNITPTLSRNNSLNSLTTPHHSSHFWASIRENLKQVIQWRKYGRTH